MTESEVVEVIKSHLERRFPRSCSNCSTRYESLADFVTRTTRVGSPVSYDAQIGDWEPETPVGTFAMANCECGTTLTLSSDGMGLITIWRLLRWARRTSRQRGVSVPELLDQLRGQIDRAVTSPESTRS